MTQKEKILTLMHRSPIGTWFLPQDFMQPNLGKLFVGYEASARLSELAEERPDLIESERVGKFVRRRLKKTEQMRLV